MHGSINYGKWEDLVNSLIGRRIVAWTKESLTLDDGRVLTIEESDNDCCACAGGEFSGVTLDAGITNVERDEEEQYITTNYMHDETTTNKVKVTFLHNQNIVATANCEADNGNGGFYYSVCSLVVSGVHYEVVSAHQNWLDD